MRLDRGKPFGFIHLFICVRSARSEVYGLSNDEQPAPCGHWPSPSGRENHGCAADVCYADYMLVSRLTSPFVTYKNPNRSGGRSEALIPRDVKLFCLTLPCASARCFATSGTSYLRKPYNGKALRSHEKSFRIRRFSKQYHYPKSTQAKWGHGRRNSEPKNANLGCGR